MAWGRYFFSCLLELILPEHCCLCGAAAGTVPWMSQGPMLCGLRPWDKSHLCAGCLDNLDQEDSLKNYLVLDDGSLVPVFAAQRTNPLLVDLVGNWKYQGLRGLVWPLGGLLISAFENQGLKTGDHTVWIPLPLHGRRQRERGFNQAEILAYFLEATWGGTVVPDLVVRRCATGQQAKLVGKDARLENVKDAFGRGKAPVPGGSGKAQRVFLVDDLVTSGATVGTLIKFLQFLGVRVEGVVCLGLASPD